jgi:SulP family sulfate permease
VHSLVVLLVILLFAPLVAYVPMASLAALLLLVAWNMSEGRHFVNIVRIAPKSDVFVLLLCFFLTVVFDMVIAASVGVVLAALLFMRRTAELTQSRIILQGSRAESEYELVPGVALYEIAGPLFFGAAQNAMGAIGSVGSDTRVIVLALGRVPSIDATGFVALESAIIRLRALKKQVVLAGPLPEPHEVFERANLTKHHDHVHFAANLDQGLALARELVAGRPVSIAPQPGEATL